MDDPLCRCVGRRIGGRSGCAADRGAALGGTRGLWSGGATSKTRLSPCLRCLHFGPCPFLLNYFDMRMIRPHIIPNRAGLGTALSSPALIGRSAPWCVFFWRLCLGKRLFLRRKRRLCDTLGGNVFKARICCAGLCLHHGFRQTKGLQARLPRQSVSGDGECSFGLRSVSRRADERRPCNRKVGG